MKPFTFEIEKTKVFGSLTLGTLTVTLTAASATFSLLGVKGNFTLHGNRVKVTIEENSSCLPPILIKKIVKNLVSD